MHINFKEIIVNNIYIYIKYLEKIINVKIIIILLISLLK